MALISPTAHRLLALSNLSGIGPVALAQIAQAPDFLTSSIDALAALTPKLQKALEVPSAWAEAQSKAAANIEQAKKQLASMALVFLSDHRFVQRGFNLVKSAQGLI